MELPLTEQLYVVAAGRRSRLSMATCEPNGKEVFTLKAVAMLP
jgi:hypothetical protein